MTLFLLLHNHYSIILVTLGISYPSCYLFWRCTVFPLFLRIYARNVFYKTKESTVKLCVIFCAKIFNFYSAIMVNVVGCNSFLVFPDYNSGLAQLLLYYSNSIVNISMNVSTAEGNISNNHNSYLGWNIKIFLSTCCKYFQLNIPGK